MKKTLIFAFSMLMLLCTACQKEAPAPTLELTGGDTFMLKQDGETVSVKFTTNQSSWGYDLMGNDWISATKSEGALILTVGANPTVEKRNATIRIFVPDSSQPSVMKEISVTQRAGSYSISIDIPKTVEMEAKGGEIEGKVTCSSTSWGITCDEWIVPAAYANEVIIAVTENTSEIPRSGMVTFYTPSEGDIKASASFTVNQKGKQVTHPLEDLSKDGTSNSYLITHTGPYCFDATVKGNGKGCSGLDAPKSINPVSAKLLWQTTAGMISNVGLESGKVKFTVLPIHGNALIAVTDASGKILWSWHIWYPEEEVSSVDGWDGAKVMNYNLGALTSDCTKLSSYGLLYQWGRKDPFPGSPVMNGGTVTTINVPVYDINGKTVAIGSSSMYDLKSNTLQYSIENPTVCLSNSYQYQTCRDWLVPDESNPAFWGNPEGDVRTEAIYKNKGTKTYFDPCPKGWRVPYVEVFKNVNSTGGFVWASGETEGVMTWSHMFGDAQFYGVDLNKDGNLNLLDWKDGWHIYIDNDRKNYTYFPATTRYDGQYAMLMGSMVGLWANYWYNTASDNSNTGKGFACAMTFMIKDYGKDAYTIASSGIAHGSRADAYAVRCIKE